MGYSEIVPGASYQEPEMRAGVERLLAGLGLQDVTLAGESLGVVLALTTAAGLPGARPLRLSVAWCNVLD
ncbi:hypothetical protein GCM10023080_053800 [Streptomyces pseudoechinosporeus]